MKREFQLSSRREFLGQTAGAMAILGAITSQRGQAAEKARTNPFAYDVTHLQKTDPKLITYEESTRWKAPHAEAKRIAIGPDDTLYICSGNYLTAMNRSGTCGLEIALAEPSRCCAVEKDGTIYLGLRDHIEVFDAKGQPIRVMDAGWSLQEKALIDAAIAESLGQMQADAAVNREENRVPRRAEGGHQALRRRRRGARRGPRHPRG